MCRHYVAEGTRLNAIPTLEGQDALTRLSSFITSAATADVEVPAGCTPSSSTVPADGENWTTKKFVEVDAEERAGVNCRFHDLQESCRVERRNVPGNVSKTAGLAVELVDDAVATSPCVADVDDPRVDELSG